MDLLSKTEQPQTHDAGSGCESSRYKAAMDTYRRLASLLVLSALTIGCTSVGHLGIVTKPTSSNAERLKSGVAFEEIGPVEGNACRHFLIAVIPFGDSTFSKAVEDALEQRGGDALLTVTVTSSLYGFVP